ncbi:MAG: phosphonate C-P lyase system protein PhnH [Verrucomicrobiota bacterium]
MIAREVVFDEVFDSQVLFRSIFDGMSRPGKINNLKHVGIEPPEGITRAAALVAFSLLNDDVSVMLAEPSEAVADYLRGNTAVRESSVSSADFIIGTADSTCSLIEQSKEGEPLYPEKSATFILMVEEMSSEPVSQGIALSLSGPGIDGTKKIFVSGISEKWLKELAEKNCEFPLGVDVIMTAEKGDDCIVSCLPRTTRIEVVL